MDATSAYFRHRERGYTYIGAIVATAMFAVALIAVLPSQARAQTLSASSFADDTPGVFLYSAGVDSSETPSVGPRTTFECLGRAGEDPTNVIVQDAVDTGQLFFIGDTPNEVVQFTEGQDLETDTNSATDATLVEVNTGLTSINDYGLVASGGDDDANFDTGTNGSITVQLDAGDDGAIDLIVPDGQIATGTLANDGLIDNSEIFIFEDAGTSGMIILLEGDGDPVSIVIDDYQRNPDVPAEADDTLITIDLDSLPGFNGTYVSTITITDDGIPTSPPGRNDCDSSQTANSIDTSVEIDAIATRTDTAVVGIGGIDIEKTTNGVQSDTGAGETIAVGDEIIWEYTVTNTGTLDIINAVVVDDQNETVVCPSGTADIPRIAPGDAIVCTATGVAVAGPYTNGSSVSGQPVDANGTPFGDPVSDSDPSAYTGVVPFVPAPGVDIEKDTNGEQADIAGEGPTLAVGDAVIWTYVVTNTGNTTLIEVSVTDSDASVVIGCAPGTSNVIASLGVGEEATCTATGVAVAGDYRNTADVSGQPIDASGAPAGDPVVDTDESGYTGVVPFVPAPGIDIEKDTNGDQADTGPGAELTVGDAVTWTYVVTNTGNVDLANVTVTDNPPAAIVCPTSGDATIALLAVGQDEICTAPGVVTVGAFENTATADGQPLGPDGEPLGEPVSDQDRSAFTGVVPFVPAPGLDIEKDTNGDQADTGPGAELTVGDAVTWTYVVTNTGNVDLANVTVTDNPPAAIVCPTSGDATIALLAVGQDEICTAPGVVTVGAFENTATADGQPLGPDGEPLGEPVSDQDRSAFTGLVPAASLGDYVWFDANRDGIQDAEEAGIAGVLVELFVSENGAPAAQPLASGTTLADGAYGFTNLDPSLNYFVKFTAPEGQALTISGAGSDTEADSNPDPATGLTAEIDLAPGQDDPTIDAGIIDPLAAIGNFVWFDANSNGVQDADEEGIAGVTVNLWTATADGAADEQIDTVDTDADGFYGFSELDPDVDYVIQVIAGEDRIVTVANAGDDRALDSDIAADTGLTIAVNLAPGETNLTLDAGVRPAPVRIGDTLFFDVNSNGIQDADEPGIGDSTVELLEVNADGTPGAVIEATTTTDDGLYQFTVIPGDYIVKFTTDAPFEFTSANQGDDDAADSDVDPATGLTSVITVTSGNDDPTIDAGVLPVAPGVSIEKTTNGSDADVTGPVLTAGQAVTWVYTVTNTGGWDLADVEVDDDREGRICVIPTLSIGQTQTCSKSGIAQAGIYVNNGSAGGNPVDPDGNPATNPDGSPVGRPTSTDPSRYEGTQVFPTTVVPTNTPVPAAPTATPVPPTPTPIVIVVTPTPVPPPLAVTGASSSDLALVAGGLVLMGGLLLITARRRSTVDAE